VTVGGMAVMMVMVVLVMMVMVVMIIAAPDFREISPGRVPSVKFKISPHLVCGAEESGGRVEPHHPPRRRQRRRQHLHVPRMHTDTRHRQPLSPKVIWPSDVHFKRGM
jgi:hypothetical protein